MGIRELVLGKVCTEIKTTRREWKEAKSSVVLISHIIENQEE